MGFGGFFDSLGAFINQVEKRRGDGMEISILCRFFIIAI
jgi:hypothetical protein